MRGLKKNKIEELWKFCLKMVGQFFTLSVILEVCSTLLFGLTFVMYLEFRFLSVYTMFLEISVHVIAKKKAFCFALYYQFCFNILPLWNRLSIKVNRGAEFFQNCSKLGGGA